MADRFQDNNDLGKAAADASSLLRARKAAQNEVRSSSQSPSSVSGRSRALDSNRTTPSSRTRASSSRGKVSVPSDRTRHAKRRPPKKEGPVEFIVRNAVYIVGVVAAIAVFLVMLMAVRSCVPTETYDFDGELDFYYESPFDWGNLQDVDGRYAYVDNGKVRSKLGIDVSENQQQIDWEAVAQDGIDYAMIRLGYRGATEGVLHTDAEFSRNLAGAQGAGVACGVYFFSQATNEKEAVEEAEYVIKQLGGAKLDYPVAFDFESAVAGVEEPRAAGLDKDAMTAIADAFCNRIERAGYKSMVYGNYYDLNMYHYQSLQQRDIWWAEYDAWSPSPHLDIAMWQYSNGGWVDGIQTAVDMNIDLSDVLD